jgi:hypothetical protein
MAKRGPISISDIAAKGAGKNPKEPKAGEAKPAHAAYDYLKQHLPNETKKPTEDMRESYGKPTDQYSGNPTENLRTEKSKPTDRIVKPTDRPTGEKSDSYGKHTENVRKSNQSKKNIGLLTGYQEKAFWFIFSEAKQHGTTLPTGERLTPKISSKQIAQVLGFQEEKKARDVMRELKEGGVVDKDKCQFRGGPGGYTRYALPESVYRDGLLLESSGKPTEDPRNSYGKPTDKPTDKPTEMVSSSSRDSSSKERTTSTQLDVDYREAWIREADLQGLEQFSVTRSLLQRCFELAPELTPEMLEDLIEAFAMHMAKSKDKPKSPRGFFIELAKQAAKGMIPLENMETPTRKALKEFVQTHEAHKEEMIQLEKQAFKLAQEAWLAQLNDEDKRTLMPETALVKINTEPHSACLRSHFAEEVWPEMRGQLLEKAPPTNA